jgi:hypothetical protein
MATVTNLAKIRKERLDLLTDLLWHARLFVPSDLAEDTEWRSKTHSVVDRQRMKVDWLRKSATS